MQAFTAIVDALRRKVPLDEGDRLNRCAVWIEGADARPCFRALRNHELQAQLGLLFELETQGAVVALMRHGRLVGIYRCDSLALDEWSDEECDGGETIDERLGHFLKEHRFELLAEAVDGFVRALEVEKLVDELAPFETELRTILIGGVGVETLLAFIQHVDRHYHRSVVRPWRWERRFPDEHERVQHHFHCTLARCTLASCRVLECHVEAPSISGRVPALEALSHAAAKYLRSPAPETRSQLYSAGTHFYPFGPTPDCTAVDALGPCDSPGSGCRSSIGFLYQVAHVVEVGELVRALRDELVPLELSAGR